MLSARACLFKNQGTTGWHGLRVRSEVRWCSGYGGYGRYAAPYPEKPCTAPCHLAFVQTAPCWTQLWPKLESSGSRRVQIEADVESKHHIPARSGIVLGIFRFGIFYWISCPVCFPCYLQHFGAGNCHLNGILQHFGVRTSDCPWYLPHFGARTVHVHLGFI